jgi:hypothetical protein
MGKGCPDFSSIKDRLMQAGITLAGAKAIAIYQIRRLACRERAGGL